VLTYGPCICVNELFGIAGAGVAAVDVAVLDVTGALVLVVVALDVAVLDVTGAVVLVVVVLLCSDAESRDYLLGHGKTLSVVSVGALLAVLAMTIVGWSVTY